MAPAEASSAPLWGLKIEEHGSPVFDLFLIGELCLLVAIDLLGADWWGFFAA